MKKTIILIHEIYGITENLLKLRQKLINKNFNVLLPSLYEDNYCGNDEQSLIKNFIPRLALKKDSMLLIILLMQILIQKFI
jgi:dienelactone hydrolase